MHLQALLVVVSFQLCVAILPVIYQKDNTVIATEPVKASLPQEHQFVSVHYPYYEVVKESSNVPEENLLPQSDSLPEDLIEIAATKLGITDWDQIPSASALGELLGTTTREETIDTIRQLTATKSGIDLIKAFIEASDYTDNTATEESIQIEADTSGPSLPTSLVSETLQKDLEIAQKIFTTPKPELGFLAKISSYLGLFDLFPNNQEIAIAPVNKKVQEFSPRSHNKHKKHESYHQRIDQMQSDSIGVYIPDSFPVPILPGVDPAYSSLLSYRSHPLRDDDEIPQF